MQPLRLHPLTLDFTGEWRPVEKQFRADDFRRSLPRIRAFMAVLAGLYGMFAFLDQHVDPGSAGEFLLIRFAIVMPFVLLFFLISPARWFERVHQPVIAFMMVLGASGIMAMIVSGNSVIRTSYHSGLLLVVISLFIFPGLRLFWAFLGWVLIFAGFIAINHVLVPSPAEISVLNSFFFTSMSIIGMVACRRLESVKRQNFALQWSLSLEKAMVAASNRNLETRIGERTRELLHANQVLRDEMQRIENLSREKDALEARLRHAERMETVGRLAGGIAHDFNNLLTAIIGNASMAAGEPPGSPEINHALEDIVKAGEKAARLTRQLLAFSRKQIIEPKPVDLNRALGELDRMIGRILGDDVNLIWKLDENAGFVLVDPGQLEQVVINLVVNARDAVSPGGCITIGTGVPETLPDQTGEEMEELSRDGFYELFVRDDGCGMDEATRDRIFEPFFTTKKTGEGTGLGLSTVFGIVRQHHGHVMVSSAPGEGSIFRVLLPRVPRGLDEGDSAFALPVNRGGSETVLLVEDDDMVRSIAEKALASLGYKVLSAAGGLQAQELSREFHGDIQLLLVDVVMPVLGGRALAGNLKKERPAMKVLFTSGYSEDIIARQGVLEKGINFIPKPYSTSELAARIREVLEEG